MIRCSDNIVERFRAAELGEWEIASGLRASQQGRLPRGCAPRNDRPLTLPSPQGEGNMDWAPCALQPPWGPRDDRIVRHWEGAKPPKQSPAQTRRFGPYPAFSNDSPGLLTSPAGMLAFIVVTHNMFEIGGTAVNLVALRLPSNLVIAIRRRAKEQGSSLNKAVIGLLKKGLGKGRRKPERVVYHDLDALAGSWSKEEATRFEAALRDQRDI